MNQNPPRPVKVKSFFTVTIPGCKYGLISAGFVVFTLIFTDFGAPKVIGANFNILATDIYRQVIGQQNLQMGAVVSIILLSPALLSSRAIPYQPKPERRRGMALLAFCSIVALLILCMLNMDDQGELPFAAATAMMIA